MENKKSKPQGQDNTIMAVLSYIGPLVIVSYLTSKDNSFVRFHIKQGAVLFVIELILWVLGMMIWIMWPLIQIVNIAIIVLSVIGIMNAASRKEKPLPLVGSFSQYIKI